MTINCQTLLLEVSALGQPCDAWFARRLCMVTWGRPHLAPCHHGWACNSFQFSFDVFNALPMLSPGTLANVTDD